MTPRRIAVAAITLAVLSISAGLLAGPLPGWWSLIGIAIALSAVPALMLPGKRPEITDHPFIPVDWMSRCAFLRHPQDNRCCQPRKYHTTEVTVEQRAEILRKYAPPSPSGRHDSP